MPTAEADRVALRAALRGAAHELNNVLVAIAGNVDLLLLRPRTRAPEALLREIQIAVELGTFLTRQLLKDGSRREPVTTDLHESIHAMAPLLRRLLGPTRHLRLELQAPQPLVAIEHGLIGQVLVNLLLNARDAMPDGGRLRIRTTLTGAPVAEGSIEDSAPGTFVRLQVIDNGRGMAPAVAARAFDPFFTTRPGRRAGLGLALVAEAVHRNDGEIRLVSRPDRGTTFSLWFKRLAESRVDPQRKE
jgi:signal transduction histidine kinase